MEREGWKKKTARIATGALLGVASAQMAVALGQEITEGDAQGSEVIGGIEVIGGTAFGSLYALNEPVRKRVKGFIRGGLSGEHMLSQRSVVTTPQEHVLTIEEPSSLTSSESVPPVSQTALSKAPELHR